MIPPVPAVLDNAAKGPEMSVLTGACAADNVDFAGWCLSMCSQSEWARLPARVGFPIAA